MNTTPLPGRHRAPGPHNALGELRLLARESAQPAFKSAAVVAAAGGLVAAFAQPASAAEKANAPVAAVAGQAPTVVGPPASAIATTDSVQALGLGGIASAAAKTKAAEAKPLVVEDLVVKNQRAAAKAAAAKAARAKAAAAKAARAKAAAAKAAAASRAAAAARASRTTSRATLTNSTARSKSSSSRNSYAPSASTGVRSSGNWATRGQCTWGALSQWHRSTGFYPGGWTGNALVWGGGAARAGYTVSSTPRARSILVMQPGVHGSSSAGHVAWVTSVRGNQVTVIEMNALAGAFNYNTRTLSNIGGMRYIYAP